MELLESPDARARDGDDRGRPGERAASNVNNGDGSSVSQRIDRLAHDALLEAMLDGERRWWLKRAEDFERAKPRVGDHFGRLSRDEVRAQWLRLDESARACRARAHVSPVEHIREDVAAVLREVA